MSVAEVVEAGAEMGSEVGACAAAAVVERAGAMGGAATGAEAAASLASADSFFARRDSEAPSVAAGVATQINPAIQTPRPSHNPQKRGRNSRRENREERARWQSQRRQSE